MAEYRDVECTCCGVRMQWITHDSNSGVPRCLQCRLHCPNPSTREWCNRQREAVSAASE